MTARRTITLREWRALDSQQRLVAIEEGLLPPIAGGATAPSFAGTPLAGAASLSATADASYTAPANAVTIVSAGASGSKIDEVVFEGIGTTLAGTITLFLYDGTNYHLYDVVTVPAQAASTTVAPWRASRAYSNLILPNGWSLRASSTVANQLAKVLAFGGSF